MPRTEQPAPVPTDATPSWELVIHDLALHGGEPHLSSLVAVDAMERDARGRETYGVPLQAGNGRDTLRDAYEEILDFTVYMRTAIAESIARDAATDGGDTPSVHQWDAIALQSHYRQALRMCVQLRGLIAGRDERS